MTRRLWKNVAPISTGRQRPERRTSSHSDGKVTQAHI